MSHVLITGSYTSDTSLSVKPAGVMVAVGGTDLTHAHSHTCVISIQVAEGLLDMRYIFNSLLQPICVTWFLYRQPLFFYSHFELVLQQRHTCS